MFLLSIKKKKRNHTAPAKLIDKKLHNYFFNTIFQFATLFKQKRSAEANVVRLLELHSNVYFVFSKYLYDNQVVSYKKIK